MFENKVGVHVPEILLPSERTDMTKWAVVACDQYTSEPEYWENAGTLVGSAPSTLHLTLPEVYLEEADSDTRISVINQTMKNYLDNQILQPAVSGFILVDRKTSHVPSRKGLVMALDLEHYDYARGSQTLIRATEGTVIERLPPRIKIRQNARVELPHIMILIDDPEMTVVEPLFAQTDKMEKAYDFDLMMDSGSVKGWKINDAAFINQVLRSLESLADPAFFHNRYQVDSEKGVLLFAVGDGNHSLASAKAFWENIKKTLPASEQETHPARFALAEIVNVHDSGIVFEPIHRVLFNADYESFVSSLLSSPGASRTTCRDTESALQYSLGASGSEQRLVLFTDHKADVICIPAPVSTLPVGSLQAVIDRWLIDHSDSKVDYIHGDDVTLRLGSKPGNIGFLLPSMNKNDLFRTVILDGALPRKTFSMGEADEKRFYLESRKI